MNHALSLLVVLLSALFAFEGSAQDAPDSLPPPPAALDVDAFGDANERPPSAEKEEKEEGERKNETKEDNPEHRDDDANANERHAPIDPAFDPPASLSDAEPSPDDTRDRRQRKALPEPSTSEALSAQPQTPDAVAQATLYSSIGFGLGIAIPAALTGLSALALFSVLQDGGGGNPQNACGIALLSVIGIGAGMVSAGPVGICGATLGSATFAYANDRSILPTLVGIGTGSLALVAGGTGFVVAALMADNLNDLDPVANVALLALPGLFFSVAGAFSVLGIAITEVLVEDQKRVTPEATTAGKRPPPLPAPRAAARSVAFAY